MCSLNKLLTKIKKMRSKYCSAKKNDDLVETVNKCISNEKSATEPTDGFEIWKKYFPKRKKYRTNLKGWEEELKDLKAIKKAGVKNATLEKLSPYGCGFDNYNADGTLGTLGPGAYAWAEFYKLPIKSKKSYWDHWIKNRISICEETIFEYKSRKKKN